MKVLIILVILAVVHEIHCGESRFCGPHLTQVLELVCVNGFNQMLVNKRSTNKLAMGDTLDQNKFNEIDDETPFTSDSLLNDLLFGGHANTVAKTRRLRHFTGVYDECCRKPCSYDEMKGYCL
ncbi:insulin-like peptide 3 [Haematobia irritans]|uniref:insulin-like peptide 3 n=1 Tax=Haematobia irritans TaxID=7368 RepID=UPI003F5025B8